MENIKHIVILVLPHSTLLNMAGPLEIFSKAISKSKEMDSEANFQYMTHVVSIDENKQVETSSNISILTEGSYQSIDYPIDTLIISGLSQLPNFNLKPEVLQWINDQSKLARRICSICAAAFILAEAGVLKGKKATTHWQLCYKLAERYPDINVEVAPLFVKDGNIYTSAGVSSGIDLALALIEEDMGKPFILQLAKLMVLFLKRPGNQVQYSSLAECHDISNPSIRKVCGWILNHLREDLSVEKLAETVAMSPRNFARVFVRELNITPAKYIERLRADHACKYLTETQFSLDEVAEHCGIRDADNLRRLFIKVLDTTPAQYRKSFRTAF